MSLIAVVDHKGIVFIWKSLSLSLKAKIGFEFCHSYAVSMKQPFAKTTNNVCVLFVLLRSYGSIHTRT